MVFGGRAFQRWLGHEGGALMNEISALITEAPDREIPLPFHYVRTQQEDSSQWAKKPALTRHWICYCLDLRPLASRTMRNKFLLFKLSSLWHFCYSSLNGHLPYKICFPYEMLLLDLNSKECEAFLEKIYLSLIPPMAKHSTYSEYIQACHSYQCCQL